MSNKRQETVADIVAEMRAIASAHGSAVSYNALREWVYEMGEVLELADRIEAAVEFTLAVETAKAAGEGFAAGEQSAKERLCKFGNAAKMREALNEIQLVCYKAGITIGYDVACGIIKSKSRAALSAPPRNCDVLANAQDALATIHNDRCYVRNPIDERRLTVNWLFAEAEKEESK